ncbi:MAG: hypothetical protein KAI66_03545 [Lentisphaeria bacterium]|nr:hypothetical protein [Lentisphaeria bacterium]
MKLLDLTVTETAGLDMARPVSGGVPLAEGAAPADSAFVLKEHNGQPVSLQTQVLARWKDGSVRWLLLDFLRNPQANQTQRLTLETADDATQQSPIHAPQKVENTATGIVIEGIGDLQLVLVDGEGQTMRAVFETMETEADGPIRRTLALRGAFRAADGAHVMQARLRVSLYPGTGAIRLEPLVLSDATTGILQRIRELRIDLVPESADRATLGGTDWTGPLDTPVRLFQIDDEDWRLEGTEATGKRAPGWLELHTQSDTTAIAMRNFREQWPKSLGVGEGQASIGLLPAFEEGQFSHMEPWFKYQYLFDGNCYQLRNGQARRWEIWLQAGVAGEQLCRAINAPLVPAANPATAIDSTVWGAIAPADNPEMADYNPWAERLVDHYCQCVAEERDYGAMNWGDWFGERRINWGNHEYDTVNQLLIQFARTGDPKYFHIADAAARHSTEVDVIHAVNADLTKHFSDNWPVKGYPPRPGMVHEHCVGHVGSFYPAETVRKLLVEHGVGHNDHPYLCLDPFNLGHVWTQGIVKHYFLTGDPFLKETAQLIGDNLARLVEDGVFSFGIDDPHFGRVAGWPLLAMAGAYELEFDDRYLAAMRNLVDRALERQDPYSGGWLYSLYPGHCLCTTHKHVGIAGFILSILVNGLSQYAHLTGDERIPEAVERAVTFLINDTWDDHRCGWRYTSCPASSFTGQAGVTVMALVNAVRLADNPDHLRVLRKAWDTKFQRLLEEHTSGPGQGKSFTATLLGCAEAVGLLATRNATTTE